MKLTKDVVEVLKYHGFITCIESTETFLKHFDTVEELSAAGFVVDRSASELLKTIFDDEGINRSAEVGEDELEKQAVIESEPINSEPIEPEVVTPEPINPEPIVEPENGPTDVQNPEPTPEVPTSEPEKELEPTPESVKEKPKTKKTTTTKKTTKKES